MLLTGRNIDLISLGALILSLGLLVDDAIIAIEIMVVRMQQGVDRVAAAAAAWSTTAAPMLSGTLVTVIGFIPIGLAPSGVSEFSGDLFWRSEEHTSELQSLMRISYAVFCLKKKKIQNKTNNNNT